MMPLLISRRRVVRRPGRDRRVLRAFGLRGHRTGGSVHFIVNNQIGFTTYPRYSRSSPLSVRRRQMIEARRSFTSTATIRKRWCSPPRSDRVPAEVPEAGRHRHVLLRRHGHDEGDEPSFTRR